MRSFLTSFFTEKGEETKVAEAVNAEKGRETKAVKAADAEKTKAAKAADAEAMEVAKKIDPQLNLHNPDYKRELRQLVLNLQEIIRQRRIYMAKKKQVVRGGMERAYLKRHPDETTRQAREFCSKNYRELHGKGVAATYDYLTQRNIKVHVDHFLKNIAKLRTKK